MNNNPAKKVFNENTFLRKIPTQLIPPEKRFIANDDFLNRIYVFHIDELCEHFKGAGLWVNPYTNKKFNERDQLALRTHENIEKLFLAETDNLKDKLHDIILKMFPENSLSITMDKANNMLYLNFKNSALFETADKGFVDFTNLKYFENKDNCFQLLLSDKLTKHLLSNDEHPKIKNKIASLYAAEEKTRIRNHIMDCDSKYPQAMSHFGEVVSDMVLRILKNSCNEELFKISQEFDKLHAEIKKFHDDLPESRQPV
ncbi:MAG: hypothetical protein V4501_08950 [Pseudomonadota bacterium]